VGYRFRRVVIHDLLDQGDPELTRMVTGLGLRTEESQDCIIIGQKGAPARYARVQASEEVMKKIADLLFITFARLVKDGIRGSKY